MCLSSPTFLRWPFLQPTLLCFRRRCRKVSASIIQICTHSGAVWFRELRNRSQQCWPYGAVAQPHHPNPVDNLNSKIFLQHIKAELIYIKLGFYSTSGIKAEGFKKCMLLKGKENVAWNLNILSYSQKQVYESIYSIRQRLFHVLLLLIIYIHNTSHTGINRIHAYYVKPFNPKARRRWRPSW